MLRYLYLVCLIRLGLMSGYYIWQEPLIVCAIVPCQTWYQAHLIALRWCSGHVWNRVILHLQSSTSNVYFVCLLFGDKLHDIVHGDIRNFIRMFFDCSIFCCTVHDHQTHGWCPWSIIGWSLPDSDMGLHYPTRLGLLSVQQGHSIDKGNCVSGETLRSKVCLPWQGLFEICQHLHESAYCNYCTSKSVMQMSMQFEGFETTRKVASMSTIPASDKTWVCCVFNRGLHKRKRGKTIVLHHL